MKYKNDNGDYYVTEHATLRFNFRALNQPEYDPKLSPMKKRKISYFIEQLLDEHYPTHMLIHGPCEFKMQDYGIILVKNKDDRIVTVAKIKSDDIFEEYHEYKETRKKNQRNQIEKRTYVRGKASPRKDRRFQDRGDC